MSKKAVCRLLEYLTADGWKILRSSDLSRTMDLTSWFMKRAPAMASLGRSGAICCINLSNTDTLQLVGAPRQLFEALKTAATATYSKGVKGIIHKLRDTCTQIKFNGNPWTSEEDEGMDARKFLLELIRRFQALDFYPYGTVNLKGAENEPLCSAFSFLGTADTIFFLNIPNYNTENKLQPHEYCMLSLNQTDRFRLIDCPEHLYPIVRQCIRKYRGSKGLQIESDVHGTHEFKLRGTPWCAEAQDVVYARLFITKVLEALYEAGWGVAMTVDMSRKMNDKAVLVMKSVEPKKAPHFCLSPANADILRVISAPPEVIHMVRQTLMRHWPFGIQNEDADFYGSHEFKLKGQPWAGRQGDQMLHIRSFLCFLIHNLQTQGWYPVASCDVTAKHINADNGPDYPIDVHSWFFGKVVE